MVRTLLWRAMAEALETIAVTLDEHIWERYRTEVVPALIAADAERLEGLRNSGYGFADGIPGEGLEKPCLFVAGRQDDSTGYRELYDILECYPHATFAVLDGAGHNLQIEKDQVFSVLVQEWLDRVLET